MINFDLKKQNLVEVHELLKQSGLPREAMQNKVDEAIQFLKIEDYKSVNRMKSELKMRSRQSTTR